MFSSLTSRSRRSLQIALVGSLCIAASFVIGIQSAGDVRPITLIEAGSALRAGDLDGDGVLTARDAAEALEIVQGYKTATPEQLKVDPDGDGRISVTDALWILRRLP